MSSESIEIDWLKKWSEHSPRNIALKDAESGREFSYQEFFENACRLAYYLKKNFDIGRGQRVSCLAANELEYLFLFYFLLYRPEKARTMQHGML